MYWSEWGKSQSIKKAGLDGSGLTTLSTTRAQATSLTLDEKDRRLYWVETNAGTIMSSDLNGNDKATVAQALVRPVGLALYQNLLYFSGDGGLYRTSNWPNGAVEKLYSLAENATDLLVFHGSKQKGSNQCSTNNGGCKHLCLALPNPSGGESVSYSCACPTHYSLQNKTCISKLVV